MKKKILTFSGIALFIFIIYSFYNSDSYQRGHNPRQFYENKVNELEKDLAEADKIIHFHFKLFKSAEESMQDDYEEYLMILKKTEPNQNIDSLEVRARDFVSEHVLRFANLLEEAVERRNNIYKNLEEARKCLYQIN